MARLVGTLDRVGGSCWYAMTGAGGTTGKTGMGGIIGAGGTGGARERGTCGGTTCFLEGGGGVKVDESTVMGGWADVGVRGGDEVAASAPEILDL